MFNRTNFFLSYDKQKKRVRFDTSPAQGFALNSARYVRGSHLCVARYPTAGAKVGKIWTRCYLRPQDLTSFKLQRSRSAKLVNIL